MNALLEKCKNRREIVFGLFRFSLCLSPVSRKEKILIADVISKPENCTENSLWRANIRSLFPGYSVFFIALQGSCRIGNICWKSCFVWHAMFFVYILSLDAAPVHFRLLLIHKLPDLGLPVFRLFHSKHYFTPRF